MTKHHQVRDRRPTLMDQIDWGFTPAESVVQNKDGSLMAGWFYSGRDYSSSPDENMNWLSERANDAMLRLGGGWAMWVDACRMHAPTYFHPTESYFPDPLSELVDEERRRHFESVGNLFETEKALILHYSPPRRIRRRILRLVYSGGELGEDNSEAAVILRGFSSMLDEFEDSLSGIVDGKRMRDFSTVDEFGREHSHSTLVNYLNLCLTGEEACLRLPPGNFYLDFVLGGMEFVPGTVSKVGDKFVSCVAIMGCPDYSYPGILQILDTLPVPYRFSQRSVFMDTPEAEKSMKDYESKWRQKIVNPISKIFSTPNPKVNKDAADMTEEAADALTRSRSNREATVYYTPVVVIHADSVAEAGEHARFVAKTIRNTLGFKARIESINTPEAFIGSLPGHVVANVRNPPLHSENLSHLLPLTGAYRGSRTNPCPYYPPNSPALLQAVTADRVPYYLNYHVGDVGHAIILGPIGAGKSTLLATTMWQALRYPGMHIWAFDLGMALYATTKALGGDHYNIGVDESLQFCPLGVLDTHADVAWAEEYISILFELQHGRAPMPTQHEEIHRAILRLKSGAGRSITDFVAEVQDEEVREATQQYRIDGPYGRMLDAQRDVLRDGRLICFEIKDLVAMGEKTFIPIMLYLFRRFERSLNGQPAMIILDEIWALLRRELTREMVRALLKGLRKLNCGVIMATQSLSDAVQSNILDVIMESTATHIFLPNASAANEGANGVPGPADFYRSFGLNPAQIDIIRSAVPKKHYYVTSPGGNAIIDLQLSPIILSFVGAGSKEDIAEVQDMERRYGEQWPYRWMERCGASLQ